MSIIATLNRPEMARLTRAAACQRPGLEGWVMTSTFCGWTTVYAPNWKGTRGSFFQMVRPVRFTNSKQF